MQPLEQLGKLKLNSQARAEEALQMGQGGKEYFETHHMLRLRKCRRLCVVATWPRGGNSISDRRKLAMIAAV